MKAKSYERLTVQTRKEDAIRAALIDGLRRCYSHEKQYDRAVTIMVALQDAGFKIVKVPRKDGLTPGLKNPPEPCLCGDYAPHTGCVDPGHWGMTAEQQAEEDAITAVADHQYGPVPVCICGHDLNRHDATGCYAPIPGESLGPEETETCPCGKFDQK